MSAIHPFHGVVAATAKRPAGGPVPPTAASDMAPAATPARPWPYCLRVLRSPAALAAAAASSDDRAAAVATEWSRT
jgi:hypothetical protein